MGKLCSSSNFSVSSVITFGLLHSFLNSFVGAWIALSVSVSVGRQGWRISFNHRPPVLLSHYSFHMRMSLLYCFQDLRFGEVAQEPANEHSLLFVCSDSSETVIVEKWMCGQVGPLKKCRSPYFYGSNQVIGLVLSVNLCFLRASFSWVFLSFAVLKKMLSVGEVMLTNQGWSVLKPYSGRWLLARWELSL